MVGLLIGLAGGVLQYILLRKLAKPAIRRDAGRWTRLDHRAAVPNPGNGARPVAPPSEQTICCTRVSGLRP